MAARDITIDSASRIDNPADRQVEFQGEIAGDIYDFAVKYSVLDMMSGADLLDEPAAAFPQLVEPIARASLHALRTIRTPGRIVIDERILVSARGTVG